MAFFSTPDVLWLYPCDKRNGLYPGYIPAAGRPLRRVRLDVRHADKQ